MRKLSLLFLFVSVFALWSCNDDNETIKIEKVASFEGLLTQPESEFVATDGESYNEYYEQASFSDVNQLIRCNNYFGAWGFGGGFTYTNKTDVTTPGFTNISAITGKGVKGSTYLTCELSNPPKVTIINPEKYTIKEASFTNCVYTYLAMKEGDGMTSNGFGAGDWLKLTIYNQDKSKSVELMLGENTNLLNQWKSVNLQSLGEVTELQFEMSSSRNNEWGMTTPGYFCMDAITLIEK